MCFLRSSNTTGTEMRWGNENKHFIEFDGTIKCCDYETLQLLVSVLHTIHINSTLNRGNTIPYHPVFVQCITTVHFRACMYIMYTDMIAQACTQTGQSFSVTRVPMDKSGWAYRRHSSWPCRGLGAGGGDRLKGIRNWRIPCTELICESADPVLNPEP